MMKASKKILTIIAAVLFAVAMILIVIACIIAPKGDNNAPPASDDGFIATGSETVYAAYDSDGDGTPDSDTAVNLRRSPDMNSETAYTVASGTQLIRTGVCYDDGNEGAGWSRVIYKGETLYTRNSCISATNPNS